MSIINNINDTLIEKRYLDYGNFKVSRNLGSLLGLKNKNLMDFEKEFGSVRFEIEIIRKKDQEPIFQVKAWTWEKDILI